MSQLFCRLSTAPTALAAALAMAGFTLGGCADEKDAGEAGNAGARARTATAAGEPVDPTAYCRAFYDLTEASNEDLGFSPETSTRAEIRAGVIAWFGSERAEQLMADAVALAPARLTADTQAVVDGLRDYAATGDDRTVARAIGKPRARIDRYVRHECPDVVD